MDRKYIEFSVDPREYQMRIAMDLPNNTPKAAMKLIAEIQRHRDFLLEQNEKLKEEKQEIIKEAEEMNHQGWLDIAKSHNDFKEENKKLKKELERTEKEKNNHKKFVDIFEERMGGIHNNYCCGNNKISHQPQYNIPMDEIDERLKNKDNIDLALHPLFKIIKHLKKENEKFKNSSTREIEATPEDITAYMKELEGEIEKLKENQLTEENAIEYVYENSGKYEDWVEGSDLYISLQKKNKELADFAEASVEGFAKLNAEINGLKEDIKLLTEAGEKTSELLWSSTEKQKKLKEENDILSGLQQGIDIHNKKLTSS